MARAPAVAAPVPRGGDWFVLQLKPGGLDRARRHLARQGVATFMPMRRCTLRRGGRLVQAIRPLFPGYLFIRLDEGAPPWRSINATGGVARAVTAGRNGEPGRVPVEVIAALEAGCGAGGDFTPDRGAFRAGDRVRIVSGPFADLVARIEAVPDRDRMPVLLSMMGRAVRARLAPAELERA